MNISETELETQFLSFSDQLKSYLYRLSANKQDAEDILHDTFIKAKIKINQFKGNSSLKTWIFAIATNLARDNKRVQNRWADDAQDLCKNAAMTNPDLQQRMFSAFHQQANRTFDIKEHINYCFTCLAKNLELEKQITIILKEVYEFKRAEIADILGITEGVVKHLLFEGRKYLQEKYNQRCALVNKNGVCYQCAELNDVLQGFSDSEQKLKELNLSATAGKDLDLRFAIINKINPYPAMAHSLKTPSCKYCGRPLVITSFRPF